MENGKLNELHRTPSTSDPQEVAKSSVDTEKVGDMFAKYDSNSDGTIDQEEFTAMLLQLGVAPMKK